MSESEEDKYAGLTAAPEAIPTVHADIVKPELDQFVAEDIIDFFRKKKGYDDVPDFMIRDVYKSYFNPQEDMKYQCGEHMYWWHGMLQNTNNYLLKTVTQNKAGYSFIATKHIIKMLRAEIEKNEDLKDHLQKGGGGGRQDDQQDEGEGDSQPDFSETNQNIQDQMEQTVKNASKEIDKKKDAEEAIGGGNLAGKSPSDIELLEERMEMIKDVILSKKEVGRLIKRSIKGFKSGFGSRTILTEESLLEADVIDDLLDQHYLFDEILAMDVNVRDQRSVMTAFDLYIDVSTSMQGKLNVYGRSVGRLNMAIALACRMQAMGCLGQIYAFNGQLWKIDEDDIWHLSPSGGTNIENCMRSIKKSGRASVILTDGEDSFETYTDNAFIMSIAPGGGSYYRDQPALRRMIRERKYIEYDGKKLTTPKNKKQE